MGKIRVVVFDTDELFLLYLSGSKTSLFVPDAIVSVRPRETLTGPSKLP
jgi:hypothetical protein